MKRGLLVLAAFSGVAAGGWGGPPSGPPVPLGPAAVHETGAPPGHTGAPGEPTCHACHNDLELNEPNGRLGVSGFPESYEPGASYAVTLLLRSEGMERAGFQATASAGRVASLGPETVVITDSLGHDYVGHAAGHTRPASAEETRWLFEWTAPPSGRGAVQLYVAANSANGDASPLGDFIYTTHRKSR